MEDTGDGLGAVEFESPVVEVVGQVVQIFAQGSLSALGVLRLMEQRNVVCVDVLLAGSTR